ncbi:MAG: tail fiber domain-containing protein [Saprospiraceae bacterium]|nr:tail fiber domain-containing protein [Saprospiraceae bacterium]
MKNIKFIFTVLFAFATFLNATNAQWLPTGNNVLPGQFLGSTNVADLVLKASNKEVARFSPAWSCSIGRDNFIDPTCSGSFAAGRSNSIHPNGNGSVALGQWNTVSSVTSYALGKSNTVSDNHSICLGIGNTVSESYSTALGFGNEVTAPEAFALGNNNFVTADHAIAMGQNITNDVPNTIMLGINQLGVFIMEGVMGSIVGINTTTPSPFSALDVNGDIYSYGNWIGSDKRFKKEIRTLDKSLDKVLSLRGTEYFFTNNEFKEKNFPAGKQIGFIAQEMEQVMPELVRSNGGRGYTVNYIGLIPVLVEAMKEQQAQIEEKDASISCLQTQMESLEARLARLEVSLSQTAPNARAFEQPILVKAFGIAPNPTNGQFQITRSETAQNEAATLLVFDGNGREVARRVMEAGSRVEDFNLNLPNGTYNISLLSNGKLSATQTLVVSR